MQASLSQEDRKWQPETEGLPWVPWGLRTTRAAALSAAVVAAAGNFLPTQQVGQRAVAPAESLSCPSTVFAGGSSPCHTPRNVKSSEEAAALKDPRAMTLLAGLRDRFVF